MRYTYFHIFLLSCGLVVGSVPLQPAIASMDSDGDGYTDEQEAFLGTDPNDSDTDDDGIMDAGEAIVGTDPTEYDTITDDEYDSDYTLDNDVDGLSNGYEMTDGVLGDVQVGNFTGEGGNPNNPDTDEDGLGDWFEATYAGTCVDITIDNSDHDDVLDPNEDCDNDTLTNTQEEQFGTNPTVSDTDGDGQTDDAEIIAGSDPTAPPEDSADAEETFDSPALVSAKGKQNGMVKLIYEDDTSLTIQAFTGSRKPKVRLTPDHQRVVVLSKTGRKLKVYDVFGSLLVKQQVSTRKLKLVKLKVWNFYADANNEIMIAAKRQQRLTIIAVRLTPGNKLKIVDRDKFEPFDYTAFRVKKHAHQIRIRHDGQTVHSCTISATSRLTC